VSPSILPGVRRFDAIIVGRRVAGCAMAIHLARAGLSVAVVERDALPSDTLSTHLIQDVALFDELGVLREVMACGAPPLREISLHIDGVDLSAGNPDRPWLCLRRIALDAVLSAATERSGAALFERTAVVDLLRTGDRVSGVVVQAPDGTRHHLHASIVIGADGRNSTVGRLVGARKYDITHNERTAYWGYYAGVPMPNAFHFARRGRDLMLVAPCDRGLTLVAGQPPLDDERDWRDPAVLESVAAELVGPLRGVLHRAMLVGQVRAVRRMDGFFRDAAGPGWALVGDAGHFKDIAVGQGICDALRQASALSARLIPLLRLDPSQLDAVLQRWWRERDADARPMYWMAQDLGRVQSTVLDQEVLRVLAGSARHRRTLQQVLAHRRPASHVTGLRVQASALTRAVLRPSVSAAELRSAIGGTVERQRDRLSPLRRAAYGASR
jgi:2-polyprenyl-6-methoxyphenol hydroxylase-like FAD-dependent oxidoreductase